MSGPFLSTAAKPRRGARKSFLALLKEKGTVVDPTVTIFENRLTALPGEMSPILAPVAGRVPFAVLRTMTATRLPAPEDKRERYQAAYRNIMALLRTIYEMGIPIVHNLPERGAVWVMTSVRPEAAVLTVENTGETLAPELVSTLVEPFQRGTERIRTDHAGVGLGLAIVKSITQAHDGTLTLTPRAAGGLRVTVQLPAAPPHTGR